MSTEEEREEEREEWMAYVESNQQAMLGMMEEILIEMDSKIDYARDEDLEYATEPLLKQLEWHQNQIQLLADEVREKMENDGTKPLTNRQWGR